MVFKEKIQQNKDLKRVREDLLALKDIENQTNKILFEALRRYRSAIIPYIKNLTPERYIQLEKYNDYELMGTKSVLSAIPENMLTENICIAAIKWRTSLFDDIPEKFKTQKVYAVYLRDYGRGLEYIPKEHLNNKLYNIAVETDPFALQWVPAKSQTIEMYKIAFDENEKRIDKHLKTFNFLQYIHNQTEEICLKCVSQNGISLKDSKYQTNEICLAAVMNDGLALQFVKNQTKDICFAAVKQNLDAILYVKDENLAQLLLTYLQIKNSK